jgi:RNA polymerase sigma-70 factor (ECF subfamily)
VDGEPDDGVLVLRTLAGDGDAFAVLYGRCKQKVWELSYYMLRDRHEAEEATQETFVKAWQRLSRYRGSGTFRSWVLSICRNACLDRLRSRSRTARSLESLTCAELAGCAPQLDCTERVALRLVLRELPRDECEAWFLVDVLGCRSDEAADVLMVRAASTIRSRVARARAQIADALRAEPGLGRPPAPSASLCGLYHAPPEKAIVAALVEPTATARVAPAGPAGGRAGRGPGVDHGGRRSVGPIAEPRLVMMQAPPSDRVGLIGFFQEVEQALPRGPRIVVLLDGDGDHAREAERWRAGHPRWEPLRTQVHGSWREEAERLLARCAGRPGEPDDLRELLALIDAGQSFTWTPGPAGALA